MMNFIEMLSEVAHLRKRLVTLAAFEWTKFHVFPEVVSYVATLFKYHMAVTI